MEACNKYPVKSYQQDPSVAELMDTARDCAQNLSDAIARLKERGMSVSISKSTIVEDKLDLIFTTK